MEHTCAAIVAQERRWTKRRIEELRNKPGFSGGGTKVSCCECPTSGKRRQPGAMDTTCYRRSNGRAPNNRGFKKADGIIATRPRCDHGSRCGWRDFVLESGGAGDLRLVACRSLRQYIASTPRYSVSRAVRKLAAKTA